MVYPNKLFCIARLRVNCNFERLHESMQLTLIMKIKSVRASNQEFIGIYDVFIYFTSFDLSRQCRRDSVGIVATMKVFQAD
jgi:hypothetical protein